MHSLSQEPRRHSGAPWRWLPLVLLIVPLGWAAYLVIAYAPGTAQIGLNYISERGFVNGDDVGVWLMGRGIVHGSWREVSTGAEMLFATGRGKVMVISSLLLVLLQVVVLLRPRRRSAS